MIVRQVSVAKLIAILQTMPQDQMVEINDNEDDASDIFPICVAEKDSE